MAPRNVPATAMSLAANDNLQGTQVAYEPRQEAQLSIVLNGLLKPIDRAWIAIRRRWAHASIGRSKIVTLPTHGEIAVDVVCDFTGDTCLRTNLLTKMTLDHCSRGDVVEIATDNLASVETIPFMLAGHGCVHLATLRTSSDWKIYARKEEPAR